jgi:hypothetical protein
MDITGQALVWIRVTGGRDRSFSIRSGNLGDNAQWKESKFLDIKLARWHVTR